MPPFGAENTIWIFLESHLAVKKQAAMHRCAAILKLLG
jgi:hypothetical protein